RAAVKEAVLQIRRGERILEAGESITKTHLLIFQAMRAAGRAASDEQVGWGGALFATLVCLALYVFARRNVRRFRLRTRDVVMLAAVLVLQLLAVRASFAGAEALRDLVRDKVRGPYWTWAGEALLAAVAFAAGALAGNVVLMPLFVLFVAPAFEATFGYVTDIQLRDLANLNHPLLKDLIVQAPGTYHHGIVIGAMVDAAARAIGANPLL